MAKIERDHSSKFELWEGGGFRGKHTTNLFKNNIEIGQGSICDCVHFADPFETHFKPPR